MANGRRRRSLPRRLVPPRPCVGGRPGSGGLGLRVAAAAAAGAVDLGGGGRVAGAAADNAHVLPGESQLLGLRAATPRRRVRATAGAPPPRPSGEPAALWAAGALAEAQASVSHVRAMQEFKSTYADNGPNVANLSAPLDPSALKRVLASVHANTFSYPVCDCVGSASGVWSCSPLYGYLEFVAFLDATKGFQVGGEQLRVWMGLYPPSEAVPTACAPPTDSPLTPFDEAALFRGRNYTDYTIWADLASRLAALYPHLVALDIDDFSSNVVGGVFDGDYVAHPANLRGRATSTHMALSSVVYVPFDAFPDLALMLDAPVFFFRNAAAGAQACAPDACPWGPHARSHRGSCLAGVCSEPTTWNAPEEVARVVAGMPPSRSVITGYYATGHSASGQPTARYVSRLLQTLAAQDRVGGVMTYCAKAALAPCVSPPLFGDNTNATLQHSLGCIVARAYAAMARTA